MSRPAKDKSNLRRRTPSEPTAGRERVNPRTVRRCWAPLALIAAGTVVYARSCSGPFMLDDVTSIPQNPHIVHLWPIWEAMSAPANTTAAGRPIVCLTLALNYATGGLEVWGYHAVNLTIHLVSALLLFGIIRRTLALSTQHSALSTLVGCQGLAPWALMPFAVALIWLVHPLQTDSVTYIIQRTELLMGCFYLLTLYCALRGWASSRPRWWLAAAVAACGLGMGSKEVMVSAPLMVLLYDRTFVTGSFAAGLRRHGGLYLGLGSTWLILVALLISRPRAETVGYGLGVEPWDYLATQAGVILHYLRLCIWPDPLVIHYDWPLASGPSDWLIPGSIVLALLALTILGVRRRTWWGFAGAWFFLILAPTSSLVPIVTEPAAERRMYLPLAAVVSLGVVIGFGVLQAVLRRWSPRPPIAGLISGSLTVAVAASLACATIRRNEDYRSALAIWSDTVAKRPRNAGARLALANGLYALGRVDEALLHYRKVLAIKPGHAETHYNVANALVDQGHFAEAFQHYDRAIRFKPDYAEAHNNFGRALALAGRTDEALAHFTQALRIKPDYVEAHVNAAGALARKGKLIESAKHYAEALRIEPDSTATRMALADLYLDSGAFQDAEREYRKILTGDPHHADAHCHLGITLAMQERFQEAIEELRAALRSDPDHATAGKALEDILSDHDR